MELHRVIQLRAQAHKRSFSQQALADLEAQAGSNPSQRRQQVLDRIAHRAALQPISSQPTASQHTASQHTASQLARTWPQTPEELIRADRDR